MTREELIKRLRGCGTSCEHTAECAAGLPDCLDELMRAAADMLESDLHESKSENDDCQNCIHQRICDLWRRQESQDASCFVDDCFLAKQQETEKSADDMFRELGYTRIHLRQPDYPAYQCGNIIIEVCARTCKWDFWTEEDIPFTPDEIPACKQAEKQFRAGLSHKIGVE